VKGSFQEGFWGLWLEGEEETRLRWRWVGGFWGKLKLRLKPKSSFSTVISDNNGRLSYEGNGERCCKKSERVTMKWRCAYGGGYIERRKWVGVGSSIMPLCQEAPIIWIMAFAPQIIQLGLPFSILFPILISWLQF